MINKKEDQTETVQKTPIKELNQILNYNNNSLVKKH